MRKAKGLTLVQLADRTNVSAATISRFERGLTASNRLTRRTGGAGVVKEARGVVIDSLALAKALDFTDAQALHAACMVAAAS